MDVLSRAFPLRRFSSSAWPAAGVGSRGPIPRERNPCLAERTAEPGWTLPLPAVPRENTARLHAAEARSHRFQPTTESRVILACRRAVAHFLVSVAEAGAPVQNDLDHSPCRPHTTLTKSTPFCLSASHSAARKNRTCRRQRHLSRPRLLFSPCLPHIPLSAEPSPLPSKRTGKAPS